MLIITAVMILINKLLDCRKSRSCIKLWQLIAYSMKSMFQKNVVYMQYYDIRTAVQIV